MTIEQWEDLESMGLAKKIPLKKEETAGKANVFSTSDGMGNKKYFCYEKVENFDEEFNLKTKMQEYEYYKAGKTFFAFSVWIAVISLIIAFCIFVGIAASESKKQKTKYPEYYKESVSITEVI